MALSADDAVLLDAGLRGVSESPVKAFAVDMMRNTISLTTEVFGDGVWSGHTVVFEEVSAFFWANDFGSDRLRIAEPDESDYLELSYAGYVGRDFGQIKVLTVADAAANQFFRRRILCCTSG